MFKSTGYLRYNENSGWVILDCCNDLAKYYRRSLKRKGLSGPPFGSHITVVAGSYETPKKNSYWGLHEGLEVSFQYEHFIYMKDGWYWLAVYCDFLHDIRESLKLPRNLSWPLHLTIAKDIC